MDQKETNQLLDFLQLDSNHNSTISLCNVNGNMPKCGCRNQQTVRGFFTSHVSLQLQLKNIGVVTTPISKKVADNILSTSKSGLLIPDDVSVSFGSRGSSYFASKLLTEMLGVNVSHLNLDIETKLQKMMLFSKGNEKRDLLSTKEQLSAGSFGSFFLQIPVEDGYTGGMITITSKGVENQFSFSSRSSHDFCTLAFFEPVNAQVQPIENGALIVLVFDLIWPKYLALEPWQPSIFPDLIKRAASIGESLKCWRPSSQSNVAIHLPTNVDSSEGEKYELFDIYCHLLEDTCCTISNTNKLEGSDKLLLTALKFIDFLDVHLVMLQSKREHGEAKRTWEIVRWMESAIGMPTPKKKAPVREPQIDNLSKYSFLMNRGEVLLFPAIAIQQRTASIRSRCIEQFDEVLNCLSVRASSALRSPSDCKLLFSDLRCCFDFCRENARTVLSGRTSKLLDLCIQTKAKKEGLALLDIITRTFASIEKPGERFIEGIRSVEVAARIALFIEQLSDWDQCGPLVLRAIHSFTVTTQLKGISILANELLRKGNRKAAEAIADKISTTFTNLSQKDVAKIAANEFEEYRNLCAACSSNINPEKVLLKPVPAKQAFILPNRNDVVSKELSELNWPSMKLNQAVNSPALNQLNENFCLTKNSAVHVTNFPQLEELMINQADFKSRMNILRGIKGQEEVSCFVDQLLIYLKNETSEDEAFQARLLACFHCCVGIGWKSERQLNVLAKIFEKLRASSLCFLISNTTELLKLKLIPQTLTERLCQVLLGRSVSVLLAESTETLMQVISFMQMNRKPEHLFSFCSKLCSDRLEAVEDIVQRNRLILHILTDVTDAVSSRMLIFTLLEGFSCLLHSEFQQELSDQVSIFYKLTPQIKEENKDLVRQFLDIANCIAKSNSYKPFSFLPTD